MYATHQSVDAGLRRIETSHFGVFNRIVSGGINAEILITGSSRAFSHYDPRIIQQATGYTTFNIGVNGSQTDMQLAVLKTYLKHNRRPSLLVHNLDSFAFETTHGGVSFPGLYLPYLSEEPLYTTLAHIDRGIWKSRYLPLYGYAVEDMNFTWLSASVRWSAGTRPRTVTSDSSQDIHHGQAISSRSSAVTQTASDGRSSPRDSSCSKNSCVCAESLAFTCFSWYSPVYYEMQALERNRAEVFARFQELAERHGASLWDLSRSPVAFDRAYFYNSQHLNAKGAARFSADVAAALVQDGWVKSMTVQPSD